MPGSAGLGIPIPKDHLLMPAEIPTKIPTNIFGPLPKGTTRLLLGWYGLTSKGVLVHTSVIDSDYTSEISVMITTVAPYCFQ